MASEDDAALNGGEQTPALIPTPALSEPAVPATVKGTVRQAFEQAQAKAAERDEARSPRAPEPPAREEASSEDTGKPTLDRTRDPHGRFVKGEGQEQPPAEKAAPEAVEPAKEEPTGIALRVPPGWSAAARVQFEHLPPEVKEAVAKREQDIASGFQALQKYKGLETYTPIIEASGISHAEFTKRAVEWEQSLRANPIATLLHVARLGNIDIVRLAQQIQQQAGQQGLQPQPPATAQQAVHHAYQEAQAQPDIEALLERKLAEREAHSSVDEFLSDPKNIHAEAVADDMALLITNGRADDLEQAYDMACNMHPEIRALLIRQASAAPASVSETDRVRRQASEARAAAKATVGAPSGPRPEQKDVAPTKTVRDTVRWAYNQAREQA